MQEYVNSRPVPDWGIWTLKYTAISSFFHKISEKSFRRCETKVTTLREKLKIILPLLPFMLFLVSLLGARICWDMQAEGVQTIKHACQLKDFEFWTQICFEVESLQRLLSWLCISLWFKIVWIIFTSNYDRMLWHLQIMSTKTAFGSFLQRLYALMRKGTRKKNHVIWMGNEISWLLKSFFAGNTRN